MKKHLISALVLLWAVALAVTGCGPKEPIRIGFAGGFTGNNSSVAISGRDAIQMAIDEVNGQGGILGRKIQLVSKDDMSDPAQTKKVDAEFVEEGIPIVVGHFMSGVAPAMMEAIKGKNILMVSPTMATESLSGMDDNFIRIILTNIDQGTYLASYIREKANNSRTMILYSDTNKVFVDGMKGAVADTLVSLGGTVVYQAEIREKNMGDMQAAIAEGLKHQADSVALIMNAGDVAMFSQLLFREEINMAVYSGTWGMTTDVLRMGGEAVEGIVFPAQFDPNSARPAYQEFVREYKALYGQEPDMAAVYSYDTIQLVLKGISLAGSVDPEKVKRAILKQGVYEGLQQEFTIDSNGDVVCPHFTIIVKDGRFVNIDSLK